MSAEKTKGPRLMLVASCLGCEYVQTREYRLQVQVSCAHPSFGPPARVGDTNWKTPNWCPEYAAAQERFLRELGKP